MPRARVNGRVREVGGEGFIWCHEFGGSMESWQPQVHYFSRRYRVITYNARGYPPSEVPTDPAGYSQDPPSRLCLLRHSASSRRTSAAFSMGGATTCTRHPPPGNARPDHRRSRQRHQSRAVPRRLQRPRGPSRG
jgi:pimeloyl-ACP methyl ester carboxylesterase